MLPNYIVGQEIVNDYLSGKTSFLSKVLPSDILKIYPQQFIYILEKKLGHRFTEALNPAMTIQSPLAEKEAKNGEWLRSENIVGVNVRTIGSFWDIAKYALTLPESQSTLHLLPIWEPGVVASLYGMTSWQINPEFFSAELCVLMPHLDTVEKQLKVVMNILHALGKTVGMDIIPHTDRYSQQVLANPQIFEWLQRIDYDIVRHEDDLHLEVQKLIFDFLKNKNVPQLPDSAAIFFSDDFSENQRLQIMFGNAPDYADRLLARLELVQFLYDNHYETVPATMGPPYRGIEVDPEAEPIVDKKGRIWRDYRITKPEKFSRVFGPLTRFKLFENKNNNENWEIDFSKPLIANWHYVAQHYADIQAQFNFDYMRGDMAHVQPRPYGVPAEKENEYYDLLGFVKNYIATHNNVPYFANYAETFLAPSGDMAYGNEIDHLEMTEAEVTLGDLQSMVVGSPRFISELRRYADIAATRKMTPCLTMMTADKDDPRFDAFYLKGNEARFFMGMLVGDMPSYMGLGYELRDPHPTPAPNEYYTKLYVFQLDEGKNKTHGNYTWGSNTELFAHLNRTRLFVESIYKGVKNKKTQWLLPPDATGNEKVIAWTQLGMPEWIFVVNLDVENAVQNIKIPPPQYNALSHVTKQTPCAFSTAIADENTVPSLLFNGIQYYMSHIEAGEARAYKLQA